MSAIISPVEALGLSGAALDGRVKAAAHHIADASFVRAADRLRADAFENEIVYERHGEREAVRIMLRPLLALPDQLTYVHHVCERVTEALKSLPALYFSDPDIRRIVRVSDAEESWLREIWTPHHGRDNPVYGRLDAVCDFTSSGWQDTLKFMEPNLSGIGGIHYAPIAEQIVMRDIVPILVARDPGLKIELPLDQRDLFVQLLVDHARRLGRDSCRLCFVEPKYSHEGPDEQSALSRYLAQRHGLTIAHADPSELEVRGGEVYYGDVCVDVAYRDYELRDLIALEKESGRPLDAMRLLLRQNRVVSSLVGDFDHKSGFEILTDPDLAGRLFSPDDCRLFARHVLWTRVISDRKTTLPNNAAGNLLEYIRSHRDELVIKPNRAYGGEGVALGSATSPAEWNALIERAAQAADDPNASWVVQRATPIPVVEFPVVDGARVHNEPFYAVMGFAATDNGLGVLCRVSQKKVVNVAQHGGLAVVLLADPPKSLRIAKRPAMADTIQAFRGQVGELRNLERIIALLEWDEETNLPIGGRSARGAQIATMESARHALLTSSVLGDVIEEAATHPEASGPLKRELFLLRRERETALCLDDSLVRALSVAKSGALGAWEEARISGEYALFAGPFDALLALLRTRASCRADGGDPYDALLDEHEPGMSRARLDPLFGSLREGLARRAESAAEKTQRYRSILDRRRFASTDQWALARRVLAAIGFDFSRGRLDRSSHPFTMMAGPGDVRLTSRADEDDLSASLLATLHEGGHGLYDQGVAQLGADSLLADGASAAMHEAQARLWENHVGRSRAFFEFLMPNLRELCPQAADGLGPDDLFKSFNVVSRGTNRVGADQLTYHLHIILRYELEASLIGGDIGVADLPEAWNLGSERLLGLRPASAREGVLQDVHWAVGLFGYFPTYTIGSLYAAQLIETYRSARNLDAEIRAGDFSGLRQWLDKSVYSIGRGAAAEDIMASATGRGLSADAFLAHLDSPAQPWNSA